MAEGETVFTFKANTKPAEEQTDSFFNSLQGKFTEINSGLELINKAVTAIAKASQAVVDFAKAGEEIKAIGIRFETIANQAGLIPEKIASGIESAVKGTVDMEDALKAATEALVTLETGGDKIPEIFDLAKKSAALFGGEVTDRFQQITMAVASGSTRMLRSIGIVIDSDQVFKNYAKSLDITADKLTQAERQQAILNAVLEKGSERFKNVNESTAPISSSLKRLSVSFGELGDTAKLAFDKMFGATIQSNIKDNISFLDILNIKLRKTFLGEMPTATQGVKLLNIELENQKKLLAEQIDLQTKTGEDRQRQIQGIQFNIDRVKEQIDIQRQLMFQEQTAQAMREAATQKNDQHANSINRITESQKKAAEEAKKTAEAAKKAAEDAAKALEQQAQILGTTFKNALVNVISQSMQTLIGNLVKGKAAFADFGKVVLGLLGQMAIQIGTVLLSTGIGMISLKFLDPTGAIAAGLGLIALGSILSAIGEGGGAGAEAGNPNAAAADAVIASGDVYQQTQEEERAAAQTGVQVVVQGNIFDSRETGLQIAQIINDSFDLNGTIIRANA